MNFFFRVIKTPVTRKEGMIMCFILSFDNLFGECLFSGTGVVLKSLITVTYLSILALRLTNETEKDGKS